MSNSLQRVVFDGNIFIQALINIKGPAGACVTLALDKTVQLYLSDFSITEIRRAPFKSTPAKLGVTVERTEGLIDDLLKVAIFVPLVPERFTYMRDQDDAHYVNLALESEARLIVSRDRDLLDLMEPEKLEAKVFRERFPSLRIIDPVHFLREIRSS